MSDYFLALDIGGTKFAAMRYTSQLSPLQGEPDFTPTDTIGTRDALIDYLHQAAAVRGLDRLKGVGVAVAGSVDAHTGTVYKSPNAPWLDGLELKTIAERALAVPAAVENDANCFALAEAVEGAGKGKNNVVGVTLGTGVGGGIVINGRVLQGSGIGSGELGHISIDYNGPPCSCGSFGCIEAYIGGWAIPRTCSALFERFYGHTRLEGERISGERLAQAGFENDEFALLFWEQYGDYLGYAMANLVNLIRPEAIVFGGSGAAAFPLFKARLKAVLHERVLAPLYPDLLLAPATCDFTGNLGAAIIVRDRLDMLGRLIV